MPWWVLFGGVGLLLVLAGARFLVVGRRTAPGRSRVGRLRVDGTIVGWEAVPVRAHEPGEAVHRMMFPIVEYPLPDGSPRRFRSPTTLDLGVYRTGQRVVVLVDPSDPRVAELSTADGDRVMGSALFTVLGLLLSGFGIVVLMVTAMLVRALA